MIRIAAFTVVCGLIAAGFGWNMFSAKHEVRQLDRQIEKLAAEIREIRKDAADLHGEYEQLSELGRLRGLVEQILPLRPNLPAQIVAMSDLERKLPPIGPPPEPAPPVDAPVTPSLPTPPQLLPQSAPAPSAAPPVVIPAAAPRPVPKPTPPPTNVAQTAAPAPQPVVPQPVVPQPVVPQPIAVQARARPDGAAVQAQVRQPQPNQSAANASQTTQGLTHQTSAPAVQRPPVSAATPVAMPAYLPTGGSALGMARTMLNAAPVSPSQIRP